MVGLADQAHKLPGMVSGGQQQRAAIARALANDPALLVADEPTGNLDSTSAQMVFDLFHQLVESGKTMIVVTHELASIALIADHVVMLEEGKVLAQGPVAELQQSPNARVRDFFARKPPTVRYSTEHNLLEALSRRMGSTGASA